MRKLIAWAGAAIFIAIVVALIFRIPRVRALVTGKGGTAAA